MKIHIVQKGDTLWKIAKKYGVNFEELKKLNAQLSNPDMIMPGMKIKVPTTGGMVKKEAPIGGTTPGATVQLGIKKEMPVLEHPFAKEQPKQIPIVEAPKKEMPIVKEAPIIKEAPKAPYTPKMPIPVIPEIDINNYYMMNMANMTIEQPQPQVQPVPQLPPKPTNILPEVKEVPKKVAPVVEAPVEMPKPVMEQPVCQDNCVPFTPVMPGPGCGYPIGYPSQACMPYQPIPTVMPMATTMPMQMPPSMPMGTEMVPTNPVVNPTVAGTSYMPPHFDDESSSFMPQVPVNVPGQVMGMGMQNPVVGQPTPYQQPYVSEMPMQAEYPFAPTAPVCPTTPGISPTGAYPEFTANYPTGSYPAYSGYPTGAYPGYAGYPGYQASPYLAPMTGHGPVYPGTMPMYGNPPMGQPYGQMGYGYPQMGTVQPGTEFESPSTMMQPNLSQVNPVQGQMPVGMEGLGEFTPVPEHQNFVPPTPPIYSAPYTAPTNVAQPPYMNPYGMGSMGTNPYMMPRYDDESNDF